MMGASIPRQASAHAAWPRIIWPVEARTDTTDTTDRLTLRENGAKLPEVYFAKYKISA